MQMFFCYNSVITNKEIIIMNKYTRALTVAFICAEALLYYVMMTMHGTAVWVSQFVSIVLCFLFSLVGIRKNDFAIPVGLAFTVGADYFLVVHRPQLRLLGMLFFLGAQGAYALLLHKKNPKKGFLWLRGGLTFLSLAACLAVLGHGADALALASLCYYASLITNIVMSLLIIKKLPLLAVGLVLFMCCDTVIGLQVAAEGYLPIEEGSVLYRVIFPSFNLPWLFYLPSQVIIALSAVKRRKD